MGSVMTSFSTNSARTPRTSQLSGSRMSFLNRSHLVPPPLAGLSPAALITP
jgi:hypothetical protein